MKGSKRLTDVRSSDADQLWEEQQRNLKGKDWLRVKSLSLNQFHFIRRLGVGAYGPVRLVKHKVTGSLYALKAFNHTGEAMDKKVIQSLNNERTLLMEVNSVWVERMYHSVQDSHFHFVLLEYIPRGSLVQLVQKEGSLQENQVRFYGAEMLMAINTIHRNGFMHRNIQPSNFLIDSFGHVKIVDFGASLRFLPAKTCLKMSCEASFRNGQPYLSAERRKRLQIYQRKTTDTNAGRMEFMAPEVVRKRSRGFLSYFRPADPATMYSFAADFWSFGVCMYYFLFGQLPFVGKGKADLSDKIVNWRKNLSFPVVLPISSEAKDLIRKLLCDEPHRLGVHGCEDVMHHEFFDSTDWLHLRDWPVPVPFREHNESSESFITPPTVIIDILHTGNRASNNDKLPGSLEPYLEDRLHGSMSQGGSRADPSDPAMGSLSMPSTSTCVTETQENVFTGGVGISITKITEDSVDASTFANRPSLVTSILTPISSASDLAPSSICSEKKMSTAKMNVSWDEQYFNQQGVKDWLEASSFSTRPSLTDDDQLPEMVADTAPKTEALRGLQQMSKENEKQETNESKKSKGESACLIM